MRFTTIFSLSVRALQANWGRSLLTILGIVIGVLAIVLVVALGNGAERLILQEFESIGATTVIVRPGRQPEGPADFADTLFSDSIGERDIEAIRRKQNVPNAVSVDPAVLVPGAVSYENEVFRPTMLGWTAEAMEKIFHIAPEEGQYFTGDDVRSRAKVVVIGSKVREELFGGEEAVGKLITLKGHKLRVVGVFPPRGQVTFFNVDELLLLPHSTAQKTILGIDYYHEIFIQADSDATVDLVKADVEATIRETHGITDPEKDDFFVNTQQSAVESIGTVTQVLTIFLVAIASIALVVGGIGIMNIMLVSVTERTREIGLRKAIGATNKDIMQQFLTEAVLLTVAGGVLGTTGAVLLAAGAAWVIRSQFALNWEFSVPWAAIGLGVGVAALVGIVFGLYPARAAARKDPIEALRYE